MALETPQTAAEVLSRMQTDVKTALRLFNGDPFLDNSWLKALVGAMANRVFDAYFAIGEEALEALPDTAVRELETWASIFGIPRIAGVRATGTLAATGTPGSTVPNQAVFAAGDGSEYRATDDADVVSYSGVAIASITRSGSTATVTTSAAHGLGSNVRVTISGATQTEYNVTAAEITVLGATTFEYEVEGTPATPATGTPVGAWSLASVPVESVGFGQAQDQDPDAAFQAQSPTVGVDDVLRATFPGVDGGGDRETDDDLRLRLLDRIQNPVAHFNVADITAKAKSVPGVTRVFVEEVTPAVGQVTVYFMRDNDVDSPIPSASEVTQVKDALLEIKPANTADADVIVSAPTEVATDFTFTALSPDTTEMRAAVTASLQQFFREKTVVGSDVDEDAYRAAIFNSIDLSSGSQVQTFALSGPSGDITIATGEIGTLGTIAYP